MTKCVTLFYEQASCCLQLAPCHGYPTYCLIINLAKIISKETGRENPKQTNRGWTGTRVVYSEVFIRSEVWETVKGEGAGRLVNGLGKLCSFAKRAGVKTMRSDLCSGLGRLPQCLLRNGTIIKTTSSTPERAFLLCSHAGQLYL